VFGHNMKVIVLLVCIALFVGAAWAVIALSPLFLNSRIERIHERNLPKIVVENGGVVYCRTKADDLRFPLPPGSRAVNPVIASGGFDTVDGTVEARFGGTNRLTAGEYKTWLAGKLQVGGEIHVETTPDGLLIKFHYFGDR
jgi:hypothetical protein